MRDLLKDLKTQRWDDHRYYHHSRINQSLHFVSALGFLTSYVMLVINPAIAALIAWLVSMTTRQAGHFFFEPKGYDHVNEATHEYKEEIKVGYNLQRKVVLMAVWAACPMYLWADPTLMGVCAQPAGPNEWMLNLGTCWLYVGLGGLLFRMVHLFFIRDVPTGVVWAIKIITDPFHDAKLYYKSPYYLMRGELIDPEIGKHMA